MMKNNFRKFTDYIEFDLFFLNRSEIVKKYNTPSLLAYQLTAAPYNDETILYLEDMLTYFVEREKYEYCCVIRDEINYRTNLFNL